MSYEEYLRAYEASIFATLGPERRNYIRQASALEASKSPGEGYPYTIVRRHESGAFIRRVFRLPAGVFVQTDEASVAHAFDTGLFAFTFQSPTIATLPLLMPPDDDPEQVAIREAIASSPTLSATAWGPEKPSSPPTPATQALRASRKRSPEQRLAKYLTTVYAAADWAAIDAVALAIKHAPDLDFREGVNIKSVVELVTATQ